jgi:hypothetical protein
MMGREEIDMSSTTITYADILMKEMIKNWGDNRGLDVADQIGSNMEDRFSVSEIHVVEARDQGAFLTLRVTTDRWSKPREFALLDSGSLAW